MKHSTSVQRKDSQRSAKSSKSKPWTEVEDETLKELVLDDATLSWSQIARIMENEYSMPARVSEEYKERWNEHIAPTIQCSKEKPWSEREENEMFRHHDELGNKWAKIAQLLEERTDNCVKNHFYCTLKKGLKKVNQFICLPKNKGNLKEIKVAVLLKAILVAEDRFDKKLEVPEELVDMCHDIKNRLMLISRDPFKATSHQGEMHKIINDLFTFNKSYKKKKKSKHNSRGKPKKVGKFSKNNNNQGSKDYEDYKDEEKSRYELQLLNKITQRSEPSTIDVQLPHIQSESFDGNKKRLASSSIEITNLPFRVEETVATYRLLSPSSRRCPTSMLLSQSIDDLLTKGVREFVTQLGNAPLLSFDLLSSINQDGISDEEKRNKRTQLLSQLNSRLQSSSSNPLVCELRKIDSYDFETLTRGRGKK